MPSRIESLIVSGGMPNCTWPTADVSTDTPPRGSSTTSSRGSDSYDRSTSGPSFVREWLRGGGPDSPRPFSGGSGGGTGGGRPPPVPPPVPPSSGPAAAGSSCSGSSWWLSASASPLRPLPSLLRPSRDFSDPSPPADDAVSSEALLVLPTSAAPLPRLSPSSPSHGRCFEPAPLRRRMVFRLDILGMACPVCPPPLPQRAGRPIDAAGGCKEDPSKRQPPGAATVLLSCPPSPHK
mmetsp:Transcript_37308/g.89333  ORF Transcript_37308/g.89333 Transcript_37308/m.89333 type:complete len:236 (-) Transcript_37308:98-805(-)